MTCIGAGEQLVTRSWSRHLEDLGRVRRQKTEDKVIAWAQCAWQVKARQEACAQVGPREKLRESEGLKFWQREIPEVQYPILQHFGFPASRRGVAQSVAAFKEHNAHPQARVLMCCSAGLVLSPRSRKVAAQNSRLAFLVNPPLQDEAFLRSLEHLGLKKAFLSSLEFCLTSCTALRSAPLRTKAPARAPAYAALRLPCLYHEDRELVGLVRKAMLGQLRAAIEHRLSNPNTVVPEKCLGHMKESPERPPSPPPPPPPSMGNGIRKWTGNS